MAERVLEGKVAIVTGASRGIGRGIAIAYGEAGAHVVLAARTMNDLEAVAKEVRVAGGEAHVVHMDALDYREVESVIDQAAAHFGRLDILVNNAGGSRNVDDGWKSFLNASVESVDEVFKMHVSSPYAAARQAATLMILQETGGSIINITSALAHYPSANVQNYSAAKVALQEMTKLWAAELGPHQIRVNAIGPGITRSATTEKLFADPAAEHAASLTVPLRRLGEPSDIAGMAVFLASDAAQWISGATVMISGGQRF